MNQKRTLWRASLALLCLGGYWCFGQFRGGDVRENPLDSENGKGRWETDADHKDDHFTFVRLWHDGHNRGTTDWPRAEMRFTERIQQLTAWQVNPEYVQLEITDPKLFNYPFAFITNVRSIDLNGSEAEALRKWLNNGGFLMVDDFWGDSMWEDWVEAMDMVYPDKKPVELGLDHPIFQGVFQLDKIPQVPSHDSYRDYGKDFEVSVMQRGASEEELDTPHFQAWYDDKGRIVVLACHNNDIADGWEEEDSYPEFFHTFSEKYCYPIGINILFYAMTH